MKKKVTNSLRRKLTKTRFEHYDVSKFTGSKSFKKFVRKYMKQSHDKELDLSKWDVSKFDDMKDLFAFSDKLKRINITGWNMKNVKTMECMFYECFELEEVIGFNTIDVSNVKNMHGLFKRCYKLKNVDVSHLNTRNVENMVGMFSECKSMEEVKGFNTINTSKVKHMDNMFIYCEKMKKIDFTGMNFSNVITMECMFYRCYDLEEVKGFNTSNLSNVKNMNDMFYVCHKLKSIETKGMNLPSLVKARRMFCETSCSELDFSGSNLCNLCDISEMFRMCIKLKRVKFTGCYMPKLRRVSETFERCFSLKEIEGFQFYKFSKKCRENIFNESVELDYFEFILPTLINDNMNDISDDERMEERIQTSFMFRTYGFYD